ncbi:MAG: hypothetical protein V3V09_09655 [Arenicellales bacterium]
MDDEQYRQTRSAIDAPRCVYEKALQYGYFTCQHMHCMQLGERESLHCQRPVAHQDCDAMYRLTAEKSGFALGTAKMPVHLTFNKAMKVQIGGMQGLGTYMAASVAPPRTDVADLLRDLKAQVGSLEAADFSKIVPSIAQFSLRPPRKKKT